MQGSRLSCSQFATPPVKKASIFTNAFPAAGFRDPVLGLLMHPANYKRTTKYGPSANNAVCANKSKAPPISFARKFCVQLLLWCAMNVPLN